MNALDVSQPMPQAPMPNQQGGQMPPMTQPGKAPMGGGMPQQGMPGGQKPAPTHAQTVAALRHFHAFGKLYDGLMKLPGLGKSDVKSSTIDGVTKLVADRFISSAQAVMLLGSFPTEPKEQRKWISDHYAKDRQAEDAILDHHRAAHKGTQDLDFENQMETSDPDNHMEDLSGMMGAHYAGNGPSGGDAIEAKQQLKGFAEGGRPNPGEPAIVGEQGPEVFVPDQPGTIVPNDQVNPLFMQSGQYPTPPSMPPMTRALPGYENIDPNELARMRLAGSVRPQAGRADFTPEHLANMAMAAGGSWVAPEYLAARAAMAAPRLAAGAIGAGALMSPSTAGEQGFRWEDPNQGRVKRLEQINQQLLDNANKATKSAPGTQKALADSLNTEKTKLMDSQNAEQVRAFQDWQGEQDRLKQEAAARKRAETSWFDVYPGTRSGMSLAAPAMSYFGGRWLGKRLPVAGGMVGGAVGGGMEGFASQFIPADVDYMGLPETSPAYQKAERNLSDPNWWRRVGIVSGGNALAGALGGFHGAMSRRLPLPPTGGGTTPRGPLTLQPSPESMGSIPAAPANTLGLPPPGVSSPTSVLPASNALAAPPANKIIERLPDGTVLTLHNPGKPGARWHNGKKWIKAEEANRLRGKKPPGDE